MGLRERERRGGPPGRDERSLEGVLPRGDEESDIVDAKGRVD